MSTRPSRNAPAPAASKGGLYCHTCGRIITPRKSHKTQPTPQKYCSDRCRREKPRPGPFTEADIEKTFVRLLDDGSDRRVVQCDEVQRAVFVKTKGTDGEDVERKEDDVIDREGIGEEDSGNDDEDEDDGGGVRLPSMISDSPSTTTGLKMVKEGQLTLRQWGMQKAKEREMVRRAARRGVAFGFEMDGGERRRVEAVQGGRVVESSFAKGEWGVRRKGAE